MALGKAVRSAVSSGRHEITKGMRKTRSIGQDIERWWKVNEVQIPGTKNALYRAFLDSLSRAINRARILLLADEQHSDEEIIDTLGISRQTVYNMRKKYSTYTGHNILALLQEHPRSGQPVKVDSRVESPISINEVLCHSLGTGRVETKRLS